MAALYKVLGFSLITKLRFLFAIITVLVMYNIIMVQLNKTNDKQNKQYSVGLPSSAVAGEQMNLTQTTVNRTDALGVSNRSEIVTSKRQSECMGCFANNFKYIILNPNICVTGDGHSVALFIMIYTVPANVQQRQAIRNTWASASRNNTSNIRHVFLFGRSDDKKLVEEEAMFKDIIMADYHDSYQNLTYKTMMGFKYVSKYCPQAEFILKTDDDMWINTNALLKLLTNKGGKLNSAVGGNCRQAESPIRSKQSKWYASYQSYPQSLYPRYCSGTGYVLNNHTVHEIVKISKNVPFFHLEDVYVGLCINKLGFKLLALPGFVAPFQKHNLCRMKTDATITVHQVPPPVIKAIWSVKCV